jgi:hypothetical protein
MASCPTSTWEEHRVAGGAQDSLRQDKEFCGDGFPPSGLQQEEQRSGAGKEASHQLVVALVDGRVRPHLAAIEAQYLEAARLGSPKPLDGFFEASQVLIGENVGGAGVVLAQNRLEVLNQDCVAGAASEEYAASFVSPGRRAK